MADIRYNVSQLFQAAFGNSPVYVAEPIIKNSPANISYSGLEVVPDYYTEGTRTSWMGTPIVFPAKLMGGNYNRFKQNGEIESVAMEDFDLPAATMFSFRRAKNITRTELSGANGTVKEIFGFDDYVIDVRGLCLDEPNQSAEDQIKKLLEWEELADSFGVSGRLFEWHKISQVCMSDWNDSLQQGKPGVIPFQFQLYSDEDIILIL